MDYHKIEKLRKLKGLTQSKLVALSGMSESGYHNMMDTQNTTVKTLEAISKTLEVSPAIFWKEDQIMEDPFAPYAKCSKCPEKDTRIKELEESNKTLVKTIETLNEYVTDLRRSSRK
jgi:transcriptional regulator with XRE-family HTH domain